ncbi:LCP family protein [Pseudogracilibacillus sp. SE30717A]|uniref:LCP family protein n=1 Tax=Pseudogracilibacillus sp. SE30717A TaxID=3098293 RepID=UPI00300DC293
MTKSNSRIAQKKKRTLKRRFKILIPFLIVIIAVGSYFMHLYSKADSAISDSHDDINRDKSDLREEYVDPKFDNVSILLMGIDSSEKRGSDDAARTDALMVATLNKDDKSIKLVSIPRDSYVYVPEVGYETKINHAHAYGGPRSTIETVENLLNIPIDYYVRVNFEAFMDVVDAVDGITMDVPYEFSEQDSKDKANAIHLYPGVQKLDGEEALALARTRKKDSDVERGKRQQEIMKALAERTLSVKSILKYDDVIEAIGANLKTNMTFSEMKSFFGYLTNGTDLDIEALNIEGEDYKPGSIYYWQLDDRSLAQTINTLEDHLELPITDYGYDFAEEDDETSSSSEEAQSTY